MTSPPSRKKSWTRPVHGDPLRQRKSSLEKRIRDFFRGSTGRISTARLTTCGAGGIDANCGLKRCRNKTAEPRMDLSAKSRKSGLTHRVRMTRKGRFLDEIPGMMGKGAEASHSDQMRAILQDPAVQTAPDELQVKIERRDLEADMRRAELSMREAARFLLEQGRELQELHRVLDELATEKVMES